MKSKERRNMKIYGMSGYNYKATPTIMLKGQWLKELGFEIGGYISVSCENGRLVITPDAEMVARSADGLMIWALLRRQSVRLNWVSGMRRNISIRSGMEGRSSTS